MPWRIAAASSASSPFALKVLPLGCTVTWNGPAAAGALVMFGYPRRLASLDQRRDFALNPEPTRRTAGPLPARARADRRLRRRRIAGRELLARPGPPARPDLLAGKDRGTARAVHHTSAGRSRQCPHAGATGGPRHPC